jgi:hypothetical protein
MALFGRDERYRGGKASFTTVERMTNLTGRGATGAVGEPHALDLFAKPRHQPPSILHL